MRVSNLMSPVPVTVSGPKFDLPSISLRTFMRSFESDADFWLTCVMPFAVLV